MKTLLTLGLVLAILKLAGLLSLSWGWATFPLWAPVALFAGLLIFVALAMACLALAGLIADDPHPPDRAGP